MRDRLIELLDNFSFACLKTCDGKHGGCHSCQIGQIADYLITNGVIVPPCKVGDTVYYISFGKIYKGKCHAIVLKPTLQIILYDYDGDDAAYRPNEVFLSKEDAEKALAEKENDNA